MKKILFYVTIVSIALLAYACSEIDTPVLDQGSQPNATFTTSIQKFKVDEEGEQKIIIEMRRGNAAEEVSVPLKLTTDEGVPAEIGFKLSANAAKFAKGEYETTVTIEYDKDEMDFNIAYRVVLEIADEKLGPLYPTGFAMTKIDVTRPLIYYDYRDSTFDSPFFETSEAGKLQKADGLPFFKIVDPYGTGYPIYFEMTNDLKNIKMFEDQPTGYTYGNYGRIFAKLVSAVVTENVIKFEIKYTLPDAGASFNGTFVEVLTLTDGSFE